MIDVDLALPESMLFFENLEEILSMLDEYVEVHNNAIKNYSEKLGGLIRSEKSSSSDGQRRPTYDEKDLWLLFRIDGEEQQRGKQEKSGTYLRIANVSRYSVDSAEASVLFKIVEILQQRIKILQNARRTVSELSLRGNRSDQVYGVSFAYGLPRHIVPLGQAKATGRSKFVYKDSFKLEAIDETAY